MAENLKGALYGQAIGDAMGAPVEGWSSARILERFANHKFRTFLPPTHSGDPKTGKGNGRITDDTLMAEALILAYQDARDHLDAYGYNEYVLPHVMGVKVWVPEYQRTMNLWDRLFYPEKYPWMRLAISNVDPRVAGVGNTVNCGVAMWMIPVGAVNAGDPFAAYQEAAAIGAAHNESFAVEAGAVMAAASAAAFGRDASIPRVLEAAEGMSRDGTHDAIVAAVNASDPGDDLVAFVARVREAVAAYDQREGHVSDDRPLKVSKVCDVGRPSRTASIEELPVALAALRYGEGDFAKTIRAAVFYGRDCDSIAGMACGLYGAVLGARAIPVGLRRASDKANQRNFGRLAASFAMVIREILEQDIRRYRSRRRSIASLAGVKRRPQRAGAG